MKKIPILIFLSTLIVFPQSTSFDFHSPQNIKLFADHLFCEKNYLRAVEQYNFIKSQFANDTINFKMMLSYSNLGLYRESNELLISLSDRSDLYPDSYLLSMKNELLIHQERLELKETPSFNSYQWESYNRLLAISILYGDEQLVTKEDYLQIFENDEQSTLSLLYDYKFDPDYKSPALAGIFSAIIPGSGKMYVGEWGDGVVALLITGLFAYLAYDNFQADHTTKAWIFTGLGAFFYAGNVYGSIASAQIFNAKIDFDFSNGLKLFLEKENYFLPEYDFCN